MSERSEPAALDAGPYAEVVRLGAELSNWSRWGADDELGTLNLIDEAAVRRGGACVRDGTAFALGLPLGEGGPHTNTIPGRFNPHHYMTAIGTPVPSSPFFCFSDDVVVLPLNAATQWDSLAHVHYGGMLYNGRPAAESLDPSGARYNGIDKQARKPLATRGIVLDVARHRGIDRLAPSEAITAGELDEVLATTGLRPEPGDVVLVRTGFITNFTRDGDRATFNGPSPGIDLTCARWLHRYDVAAVASDTVQVEVTPSDGGTTICPLHLVAIRDMGMVLGEMWDLEALSSHCAATRRWDVQLIAQPLAFTGGINTPLNPIAIT